jgi:hypothetical protein
MPWSVDDVNKHCKNLSPKAKKVWVEVANKALAKCRKDGGTDCEASAIRQANSVASKLNESLATILSDNPEFIPEDPTQVFEQALCIQEGKEFGFGRVTEEAFIGTDGVATVKIFESKDEKRDMEITFIQSGWSKNKNYWSPQIVKNLTDRLIPEACRQYTNHFKGKRETVGRTIEEWASTAIKSWWEDINGITYGKAIVRVMPDRHPASYIYEMAKDPMHKVGVSVDTLVKAKKGKIDNEEGFIIEQVAMFLSADYVDAPSAGGVVNRILEDEKKTEGKVTNDFPTFKDYADWRTNRQKFEDLHWFLMNYIIMILQDTDIEDKKSAIDLAIDAYALQLKEIPFADVWTQFYEQEELAIKEIEFSDKLWGSVKKSELPSSAFLVVGDEDDKSTWHLPYKDDTGKVNKGALGALALIIESGQFRGKKLSFSIPAEVKAKILRLLKQAKIEKFKDDEKESEKYMLDGWFYDVPLSALFSSDS